MIDVVRLEEAGGPEVLKLDRVAPRQPGPGEVWLEQRTIGVNYLDVTQRNGALPIPLPNGLGLEGAGYVRAVGAGVTNVAIGNRVAYALGPLGSYASERSYPAERLIHLPGGISFTDAAATLFKGLTAQYLIKSTYPVAPGTVILLYGAAGAVGQIMAAWATHLGATVIGVVSRRSSIARAQAAGSEHVLVWGECDVPAEVRRLSRGEMAHVVYDGVGKPTFEASIDSLRSRGMMVSFGASSGAPDAVALGTLNKKSLFLTRPGLAAHITDLREYRERARDVFDALTSKVFAPNIWREAPLSDVVEVHRLFDAGANEGAIVLTP